MDGYARHVKAEIPPARAAELAAVDVMAERLLAHIVATAGEIASLHVHGAQSRSIQDHFAKLLKHELGFGEEVVLTPQSGLVTHARPDFFFDIGQGDRLAFFHYFGVERYEDPALLDDALRPFDVQARGRSRDPLPEDALASIAAYYRRDNRTVGRNLPAVPGLPARRRRPDRGVRHRHRGHGGQGRNGRHW